MLGVFLCFMTPEPHHKKIYLTFFLIKTKVHFIQLLAHAPVLLFIKHYALSVDPDSQTAIHYCVCPARLQNQKSRRPFNMTRLYSLMT